mmetsp:Transcript_31957/g.77720  ORF Transcript_31957/g.77720 Transcript_31957/m.77720 type:complete len:137 (-) Transcript_31957:1634-2044(-)
MEPKQIVPKYTLSQDVLSQHCFAPPQRCCGFSSGGIVEDDSVAGSFHQEPIVRDTYAPREFCITLRVQKKLIDSKISSKIPRPLVDSRDWSMAKLFVLMTPMNAKDQTKIQHSAIKRATMPTKKTDTHPRIAQIAT